MAKPKNEKPKASARKPATAKKTVAQKSAKSGVSKPGVSKKTPPAKKAPAKNGAGQKSPASKKPVSLPVTAKKKPVVVAVKQPEAKMTPFLKKQKDRLLQLRDGMLDSMTGVARDNLRSRAEGSEASAFGMHQADAGSDAYDRDFALSLLSQEQDALYEIDAALKRIELGNYGMCEMSGKPISHARLEAIPFARFTVECQSQLEKQRRLSRTRQPVTSLFGLTDEEGGSEGEEEETTAESKE